MTKQEPLPRRIEGSFGDTSHKAAANRKAVAGSIRASRTHQPLRVQPKKD